MGGGEGGGTAVCFCCCCCLVSVVSDGWVDETFNVDGAGGTETRMGEVFMVSCANSCHSPLIVRVPAGSGLRLLHGFSMWSM